jgi:thiol-disulfide isomerase/thioredoxin
MGMVANSWTRPSKNAALLAAGLLAAILCGPAFGQDAKLPALQSHGGQFTRLVPQEEIPDRPVIALDGSVTHLAQIRNRILILNFWATWCPACRYELPALARLARDYRESDLAVAAVSIDEGGFAVVLPYLQRNQVTGLAVFLDPEQSLGSQFRDAEASGALPLFGLPMTYFIDRDGTVLGYISGAVEWDTQDARNFVDSLLSRQKS